MNKEKEFLTKRIKSATTAYIRTLKKDHDLNEESFKCNYLFLKKIFLNKEKKGSGYEYKKLFKHLKEQQLLSWTLKIAKDHIDLIALEKRIIKNKQSWNNYCKSLLKKTIVSLEAGGGKTNFLHHSRFNSWYDYENKIRFSDHNPNYPDELKDWTLITIKKGENKNAKSTMRV